MKILKTLLSTSILLVYSFSQALAAPPTRDVNVTNDETSPVPVNPQTIVEWRYVGLTTAEDDGRFEFATLLGIAAMNKACAADFGPGARAAMSALPRKADIAGNVFLPKSSSKLQTRPHQSAI